VESELISFGEALKKNPAFASYLQNPTISRKEKVSKVKMF
jgi:F0F1-type ATP synthase delta subunit